MRCQNRSMAKRVPTKLDAGALWNYAARLLGGRALTIGELQKKLSARAAQLEDVQEVLSRLKQAHVLNDRTFADSYTVARRDGSGGTAEGAVAGESLPAAFADRRRRNAPSFPASSS